MRQKCPSTPIARKIAKAKDGQSIHKRTIRQSTVAPGHSALCNSQTFTYRPGAIETHMGYIVHHKFREPLRRMSPFGRSS